MSVRLILFVVLPAGLLGIAAAAAWWRLVLGRLRCRPSASGFPTWMHRSF